MIWSDRTDCVFGLVFVFSDCGYCVGLECLVWFKVACVPFGFCGYISFRILFRLFLGLLYYD